MKVVRTIILCSCIAAFVSCVKDPAFVPETHEPEVTDEPSGEGGGSGEESPAGKNYALSGEKSYATGLDGLSSICLNEKGDGFYIAQDGGLLYEAGLDGTVKGTVPFKSSHDWEGVTVNPADGTIYLCEEREWAIYKVNADHKDVTLVGRISVEGGVSNKGFEGITYGKGFLYVANQASPSRIYKYSIKEKKVVSTMDISFAEYLSDIFYEESDGSLWITDSKKQRLTNIDAESGETIAEYNISFVKKPEGFCLDKERKMFWFCCDKTGNLHSISYK